MINTIYGAMDEFLLEKTVGEIDNDNEHVDWVEYRIPGKPEVVHRSVNMILKKPIVALGDAATFF